MKFKILTIINYVWGLSQVTSDGLVCKFLFSLTFFGQFFTIETNKNTHTFSEENCCFICPRFLHQIVSNRKFPITVSYVIYSNQLVNWVQFPIEVGLKGLWIYFEMNIKFSVLETQILYELWKEECAIALDKQLRSLFYEEHWWIGTECLKGYDGAAM